MDVFSAMQTAVSGLQAQAFSLNNISGNIANAQTTGYRRIDTTFADLLAEQPNDRQTSGSVAASSQFTNTLQGNIASTGITTNMALNGGGFFVVRTPSATSGGQPSFTSQDLYTRRGDFAVDKDGYLVNGAGSYLVGQSLDPRTGQATGNGVIRIGNQALPAQATTTISYAANLPSTPGTTGPAVLGALAGGDVRVMSGTSASPATVAASDSGSFLASSLSGGSLTAYSAAGGPVNLQLRWAKVAAADSAAGTGDTWNLFYAKQNGTDSTATAWTNAGTAFTFNASGQLTTPAGGSATIPNVTVDGVPLGTLTLNTASGGLTQYGAAGGQVTTNTLQQNGSASGTLRSLAVTSDGRVTGTYSNGTTATLAQVGIARFNAPDALKAESLGNYAQTVESGGPVSGLAGTTVVGGNVEQSNTDTANEFSKLIITQQAYSANTRVMSTAQQMMSDLVNIIR
ncbi:flagellar basal body FlaE domain protein [Methylobacterium sp. 4-46]|uniref:flagellar hook protein FlgE n=1 Tax=unclassified Methylobacterium TaxID=2615210 RepID=UPI000152C1E1|nr:MULTISPECIES: flagellar hook-basal body complex protein [Methylobacterium]ACA18533.1 flagellar basal body FlaE domain protein [Methylobacterium sp. 4-46]WFT77818.1 flagellar hook-basal body complex protein [Methylobacterium nodulans]